MQKICRAICRLTVVLSFFPAAAAASVSGNAVPISEIRAERAAPDNRQPTVLRTANGLPQVNIQTPSAAGVSLNRFSRFDVDNKGAVLNNSRTAVQSRLAGQIQANPWLAAGTARIIVNQINAARPSLLNGYIEVAGSRAEVVMANPAGIRINGGGFINASGVTLAAGNPLLENGVLSGYRIRGGNIAVDGGGLDTSGADYTRILSQAAQINAGIWAKNLSVIVGSNDIAADGSFRAVPSSLPAPPVAVDTGVLGGMYAGKITLISNNHGAAVQNAGQIFAAAGGLTLSADGKVGNSGSIIVSAAGHTGALSVNAAGFANSGTLSAQGKTALSARNLHNSGLIAASDVLTADSQNLLDNSGKITATRIDADTRNLRNSGTIAQTGLQGLALAAGTIGNSGYIGYPSEDSGSLNRPNLSPANISAPTTAVAGGSVTPAPSAAAPLILPNGKINVSGSLTNSGTITANGGISLTAHNRLTNSSRLYPDNLTARGTLLDNRNGKISVRRADVGAHIFDNRQGAFTAAQILNIHNTAIDNQKGSLKSGGSLLISTQNMDNESGEMTVNQNARISTKNLSNRQGRIDTEILNLTAENLDNREGIIRNDNGMALQLSGSLNNQGGLMTSRQNIDILDNKSNTLNIDNSGEIFAGNNLFIQAESLHSQNTIAAGKDAVIALKNSFTAAGNIYAGTHLKIDSEGSLKNRAVLEGVQSVQVNAANIDNTAEGKIQAGGSTELKAENITNRGLINSNGLTLLQADNALLNTGTGRIYGGKIAVAAHKLANRKETVSGKTKAAIIAARRHLAVGAHEINNREHGLLFSAGTLAFGGSLDKNHNAQGSVDEIKNLSATIESLDDMAVKSRKLINSNAHFTILPHIETDTPESFHYIVPEGSQDRIAESDLKWVGFSRAGQYIYKDADKFGEMEYRLGSTPIPDTQLDYSENSPLWAYFGIEAPKNRPKLPQTENPVKPQKINGICDNTSAAYHAAACGQYHQALAKYHADMADIEAYRVWEELNGAKFEALSSKVAQYNSRLRSTIRNFTRIRFTRRYYADQVGSSDPAQLISGGNMLLEGSVINDKSRIVAGKKMLGGLERIENTPVFAYRYEEDSGTQQYSYSRWRGGFKRYHERKYRDVLDYREKTQTLIDLGVSEKRENAAYSTQNALSTPDAVRPAGGGIRADKAGKTAQTSPAAFYLPDNGLAAVNPQHPDFLIETDAAFTDYRRWLGSDYMLKALNPDSGSVHKRLGDGFYEQRSVNEQIARLTGYRRLDGYSNDEAQFKALMDSGISHARALALTPGIALSAAQMARLTADIVWPEKQAVVLPDGSSRTVLVPKVYLKPRNSSLSPSGSLITAQEMHLHIENDVINGGTIAAHGVADIAAAEMQIGGNISGSEVSLSAQNNISVRGGSIVAEKALSARAGGSIAAASALTFAQARGRGFAGGNTTVGRVAGLMSAAETADWILLRQAA